MIIRHISENTIRIYGSVDEIDRLGFISVSGVLYKTFTQCIVPKLNISYCECVRLDRLRPNQFPQEAPPMPRV